MAYMERLGMLVGANTYVKLLDPSVTYDCSPVRMIDQHHRGECLPMIV